MHKNSLCLWKVRPKNEHVQADQASNKGKQEQAQWETGGDKTSGRQTHHPRKGNKKGEKLGAKERKSLGKADSPSNKG
jgi:hypothetical protein